MAITLVHATPTVAVTDIFRAWDRGEAVLVVNPGAPEMERQRLLEAMVPNVDPAPEVAAVVATSGTSGQPRGVELTWAGLISMALATSSALATSPSDVWLGSLPPHHVGGLAVVARSWVTGTRLVALDRFDPSAIQKLMGPGCSGQQPTLTSLVPTMVGRLLEAGVELGGFRRILVGGAPWVGALPPQAIGTYGLSECWGGMIYDGEALPGTEVRLGPDDEVFLRGPTLMRGYRLDPIATAAAIDPEGWLHTGDVGTFDRDGRLRIVDRLRDLIITGGVNVSPTEVERVLARHPAVADVGVAAALDAEWGQRVVAHVVARDPGAPPSLADLRAFAAEFLSSPKLPRQLELTDALPRTASGKLLRRHLKVRCET